MTFPAPAEGVVFKLSSGTNSTVARLHHVYDLLTPILLHQ